MTHLTRVVEVGRKRIGRESIAKVGRCPPSSAKMLSLVFGQRFRNRKRLDPRPDQVISLRFERVGLGIPSLPLAVDDVYLVQTPEKQKKDCELQRENRGVPLFTSPTLNISRIEEGKRGFVFRESKLERNE